MSRTKSTSKLANVWGCDVVNTARQSARIINCPDSLMLLQAVVVAAAQFDGRPGPAAIKLLDAVWAASNIIIEYEDEYPPF